jgi:hypothetical protein
MVGVDYHKRRVLKKKNFFKKFKHLVYCLIKKRNSFVALPVNFSKKVTISITGILFFCQFHTGSKDCPSLRDCHETCKEATFCITFPG